ncbi:MAG TPA: hypothetical protein VF815_29135 [Myxococcaceae bacterium]|jgi:hypothetical protein
MTTARLEQLGLRVEQGASGSQAVLNLPETSRLENPVTRQPISRVTFQVAPDRLTPVAPPALVGLAPIMLSSVTSADEVTGLLSGAFDEYLFHLERRSAQLNALGLSPSVDPETLELSTELEAGPLSFKLVSDRQGHFRVGRTRRGAQILVGGAQLRFELSEFRERTALSNYLTALVEESAPRASAVSAKKGLVSYADISQAFGAQALVPPRSSLEVLVQLSVNGESYRFAAARLEGRTFRGLLAGAKGKVWSERFELDDFPGVVRLVADLLKVSPEAVKLVGPDTPQE